MTTEYLTKCFRCGKEGLDLSDRSPWTPCDDCRNEEWELMLCPLDEEYRNDKCKELEYKKNKDVNVLQNHLIKDHKIDDLAHFIAEVVQDHWD